MTVLTLYMAFIEETERSFLTFAKFEVFIWENSGQWIYHMVPCPSRFLPLCCDVLCVKICVCQGGVTKAYRIIAGCLGTGALTLSSCKEFFSWSTFSSLSWIICCSSSAVCTHEPVGEKEWGMEFDMKKQLVCFFPYNHVITSHTCSVWLLSCHLLLQWGRINKHRSKCLWQIYNKLLYTNDCRKETEQGEA